MRAWVMQAPPPLLPTSPIYDALRPVYRVAQTRAAAVAALDPHR